MNTKAVLAHLVDEDMAKRVNERVLGLRIALECEEAVVAHMARYNDEWIAIRDRKTEALPDGLMRRVRQHLDSKHTCEDLRKQIAELEWLMETVA